MKLQVVALATLAAFASAGVVKRQSSNDLSEGGCKKAIFIFARGSTERGNMGAIAGQPTCTALKRKMPGEIGCQGVGPRYTAAMGDNGKPGGTSPEAVEEAISFFNKAAQKCPNMKITFGGYSQGGAVMHGAVAKLSEDVKAKVVGGVLFGDSLNRRTGGSITAFQKDRILEICASGDGVCAPGSSGIGSSHLSYSRNGSPEQAAAFLVGKINGK